MADDLRSLIAGFYERVSSGDLAVIDDLAADDIVEHEELPGLESGKDGVKQFFAMLRAAFPDLRMDAHEIIAEGDLVAARFTLTGTHRGEFMGIAPTGNRVEIQGFDMARFRDGKFVEHWGATDMLAMMQQLGAIPATQ